MLMSDCRRCSLRCGEVVLPAGSLEATLFVVGDKPTSEDELMGQAFSNRAGTHVKKLLVNAGFSLNESYLTYAVKCVGEAKAEHVKACKWWLWQEIRRVQPQVILTLGAAPSALLLKDFTLGQFHSVDFTQAPIACWFHPTRLLNQGKRKDAETVSFFQKVAQKIC